MAESQLIWIHVEPQVCIDEKFICALENNHQFFGQAECAICCIGMDANLAGLRGLWCTSVAAERFLDNSTCKCCSAELDGGV